MVSGWTDNKAQGIGRARGGAVVRDIASGEGGWILLFHTELITAENKTRVLSNVSNYKSINVKRTSLQQNFSADKWFWHGFSNSTGLQPK